MGTLISAVMIVKNEQRCIIRCLSSIVDAVDEIVIVDTGSTDNTLELIEEYRKDQKKIRLYHFEWIDDFSAARNFAISKARGTWKLTIDADEFLHPEDVSKIRDYCKYSLKQGFRNVIADVNIINIKNSEVADDIYSKANARIFTGVFKYHGKMHETLTNDYKVKAALINMPIRLYHDGYDPEEVNQIQKGIRNVRLLESAMKEEPDNIMNYIYFAGEAVKVNVELAVNAITHAEDLFEKSAKKDEIVMDFLQHVKKVVFQSAGIENK
ncbi:glycosyltransferase family 2 protein [Paenibacillus sp. SN-8-1]|uniref:glycosyltransferase family 2 protein n=1 Tax=Paenibacillus sp. SN-8-1 TaxID=3435409 RepID=UPI003D9A4D5F